MSMSSGCNHLRIFLMNIFQHRTFKKLWYMFQLIRSYPGAFPRIGILHICYSVSVNSLLDAEASLHDVCVDSIKSGKHTIIHGIEAITETIVDSVKFANHSGVAALVELASGQAVAETGSSVPEHQNYIDKDCYIMPSRTPPMTYSMTYSMTFYSYIFT